MKYIYAVLVVLIAGIILAIALAVADKFLKVEENPAKKDIEAMLPGANCGACGFPGCAGLAQAMADKKVKDAHACKVINGDKANELQTYINEMK